VQRILCSELRKPAEVTIGGQQFLNAVTKAESRYSSVMYSATLDSGLLDHGRETLEEAIAFVEEN
jgi:hypothetical protein